MSTISKSLLISFAEKYTALLVSFGSTVVLARLLTPEEIGVFSVAAVLVGMAHMLRDFGVSQYIVQERELTLQKMRSALGAAILFAWVIAFVLLIVAQPVSEFYEDERVETVIFVLSLNFFLLPFGSVTLAMMRREFRFGPIYRVQTASAFAHAGTSIGLAMAGYGFLSLAWSAVVGVLVTVVGLQIYRPKEMPYLPGCSEFRSVFSFGGFVSVAKISKEARTAVPDMVIGKMMGMETVGLFGRAMGLIKLFEMAVLTAVRPVVLPHFSAESRAERDVGRSYLTVIDYIIILAWPFYGVVFILAYPIIRILYGTQWDGAVPIAQILCGYGAVTALFYYIDQVLIAVGSVKKTTMFHVLLLLIVIPCVIAGGESGLDMVAYMLVITNAIGAVFSFLILMRLFDLELRILFISMGQATGVLVCCVAGPLAVVSSVSNTDENLIWILIAGLISSALGWVFGVIVLRHPIRQELYSMVTSARRYIA